MPSGEEKDSDGILKRADELLRELKAGGLAVSSLLISFKELVMMLNSKDHIAWGDNEMAGYGSGKEVPDYRLIRARCTNEDFETIGLPQTPEEGLLLEARALLWQSPLAIL